MSPFGQGWLNNVDIETNQLIDAVWWLRLAGRSDVQRFGVVHACRKNEVAG